MGNKKTVTYVSLAVIFVAAVFLGAREAMLAVDLSALSGLTLQVAEALIDVFTYGPVVLVSAFLFNFFGYLRKYFKGLTTSDPDAKYQLNKALETIMYYLSVIVPFLSLLSLPPISTLWPEAPAVGAAVAGAIATVIRIVKSQQKDLLDVK